MHLWLRISPPSRCKDKNLFGKKQEKERKTHRIQFYCVSLQRNNYLFYFNSIRMKKEIIDQLYNAFEQFALEVNGVECWSARELQKLLG